MDKAIKEPSWRAGAIAVGFFLVSALGPGFIAPELQTVGLLIGIGCLFLGFWPQAVKLHAWGRSRLPKKVKWFVWLVWLALVLAVSGVGYAANSIIQKQRYHLSYQVCGGELLERSPNGSSVGAVKIWTRLLNRNTFPVVAEVTESSLTLGGRSASSIPRETITLIPDALTAIRDGVRFTPPVAQQFLEGQVRYVVKFGASAAKLDRTMIIKGKIEHEVAPNGERLLFSFTPDGDSDPNYVQRECYVTDQNRLLYRGR